jgi:2-polyprenyl-6-methoxyphenol hydroxylase-like FAD-dependent oxidoreductase
LTLVLAAWPHDSLGAVRRDLEGSYHRAVAAAFGSRLTGAQREERIVGGGVANRFRVPHGPGWALVGDAGYLRDPVTAQGITDAFLDAELCTAAVHDAFSGVRSFDEAMATYQRLRDARVDGIYELTTQLATLEPPPADVERLLGSIEGDTEAMDRFAGLFAGTTSAADFLATAHPGASRAGRPGTEGGPASRAR